MTDVLESIDPATGNVIWRGKEASVTEITDKVSLALAAFPKWRDLEVSIRASFLQNFLDLLSQQQQEFAELISTEMGKPLWEAKLEVSSIINKLATSQDAMLERCPEKLSDKNGVFSKLSHKPHGVVAVFGPFNFPGHLPLGHIIPALLAGNVIMFKPSEFTPKVGVKIYELFTQANLPDGVLNLVQGGKRVGEALVTNKDINGIYFTGSYAVGAKIAAILNSHPGKILALEMGGNNPLIVANINNITAAVYNTIQSAFITSGQRCTCARRLIVIKNDTNIKYVEQLIAATKNIIIGAPLDSKQPFMGPLINTGARDLVINRAKFLIQQGAVELLGCNVKSGKSAFISPGIYDVTKINYDDLECFGPILQLIWVDNLQEALLQANNTEYGLSAGILSQDLEEFNLFYKDIRAGIVNWNRPTTGASGVMPFGGVGKSGNYRPSAYYAADYCSYPVASTYAKDLILPEKAALPPGIILDNE